MVTLNLAILVRYYSIFGNNGGYSAGSNDTETAMANITQDLIAFITEYTE